VKPRSVPSMLVIATAFLAGLFSYHLYERWNRSTADRSVASGDRSQFASPNPVESRAYPATFVPPNTVAEDTAEVPTLQAREIEKIRALTGRKAKIRGTIFRVGHSSKSNTYFLNFGPSREALTAVIFASAVELFEKNRLPPKELGGKEVEIQGEIKDHPQYGLEIILESPSQIKIVR
jgi:hypothetical protein